MRNFLILFSAAMLSWIQLYQYTGMFWSSFFTGILIGVFISAITFRRD